jgi:hypothetical protein
MNTLKLIGISALALAALSGCARYDNRTCKTEFDLVAPTTYEGKTCVMRCGSQRTQCRDNKQQQYINCDHYNRMAALEFDRCLASGATNCYSPTAPPCERPCSSTGACADECEAEYRQCYQSCGGQVVSREVCTGDCGWGGVCN